ncbi:MAG: IS3 family transposase, partial [Octadecabacter sp.]
MSGPHEDVEKENERLRKEVRLLREEREVLKRRQSSLRAKADEVCFHRCLQSYGRPRMTEELQELGLKVGHRRIGRLMRANDIKIIRTQKYKATTDSN